MKLILILVAALTILTTSSALAAKKCTPFETQAFKLIDEAGHLSKNPRFIEYGWSANGPANGWIDRWHKIRDNKLLAENFTADYGPILIWAFQVTDEYRTAGQLDSFWSENESFIQNVKRCKY